MNIVELKIIQTVKKISSKVRSSRFNFLKTCRKIERGIYSLQIPGYKINGVVVKSITFKR